MLHAPPAAPSLAAPVARVPGTAEALPRGQLRRELDFGGEGGGGGRGDEGGGKSGGEVSGGGGGKGSGEVGGGNDGRGGRGDEGGIRPVGRRVQSDGSCGDSEEEAVARALLEAAIELERPRYAWYVILDGSFHYC